MKLGYPTFLKGVLQYHLCIVYGHLTSDTKRQYNHHINMACELSKGKVEASTVDKMLGKMLIPNA